MPQPLVPFVKGEPRTLLEVSEANKLIAAINAQTLGQVSPAGAGSIKAGDSGWILDLSPLMKLLAEAKTGELNEDRIREIFREELAKCTVSASAVCIGDRMQVTGDIKPG